MHREEMKADWACVGWNKDVWSHLANTQRRKIRNHFLVVAYKIDRSTCLKSGSNHLMLGKFQWFSKLITRRKHDSVYAIVWKRRFMYVWMKQIGPLYSREALCMKLKFTFKSLWYRKNLSSDIYYPIIYDSRISHL